MWWDSQLAYTQNVETRGPSSTAQFARWHFHFWVGGPISDSRFWNPPASIIGDGQYMYVKRFVISESPITH